MSGAGIEQSEPLCEPPFDLMTGTGRIIDREVKPFATSTAQKSVILINGVHSTGEWHEILRKALYRDGQDVGVYEVDLPVMYPFGILIWARRRHLRRRLSEVYRKVQEHTSATSPLTLICHSYGSFLGVDWLRRNRTARISNFILLGSIVKHSHIRAVLRCADRVINHVGVKDRISLIAAAIRPGVYGLSGVIGLKVNTQERYKTHNRFFEAGHNDLVWSSHLHEFVVPTILNGEVPLGDRSDNYLSYWRYYMWRILGMPIVCLIWFVLLSVPLGGLFLVWRAIKALLGDVG